MMYFMMGSILHNENVRNMNHGDMVIVLLNIGMWVTMIFAVVFLFYTNSFLIKRRQKEIGLYNILGMEKRHIAKMMFYETLFTAVVSIGIGMLMGMLFGKLMFLLLIKLIGSSEIPAFQIPSEAVVNTLVTMALVFFAILLYNLARIHLTKPIELIHGGQIGEKEPKTKILLTIIGVLTMGAGYTFALTAKTPFQAKKQKVLLPDKAFYKCIWNALQNEAKCSWAGQYMYSFNYGFNQRINYGVYVSWYGGYTEYGLP